MHIPITTPWAACISLVTLVAGDLLATESTVRAPQRWQRSQWTEVNPNAAWAARAGLQVVVLANDIYVFGGFGISADPANPFKPSNPMDLWVSRDGADWRLLGNSPWNATTPEEIKYDFKALAVTGGRGGRLPSIFTFGGDRETFNFADPSNYLRVDNDVWRFSPALGRWR